jgi:hypothetical protein
MAEGLGKEVIAYILVALVIVAPIQNTIRRSSLIRPGTYFVYRKRVEVEFYASGEIVAGFSRIVNGYCSEVAVYNVTRSGEAGFIMEKHRSMLENESSSPFTCRYLSLVDVGEKKTWVRTSNPSILVMMFDWKYLYLGPVFTSINYNGYPLPWARRIYFYMSLNTSTYTYNLSSSIAPSHGINGLNTLFYNIFEAVYDRGDGFLEYMKYTIVIYVLGKPYATISMTINRVEAHYVGVLAPNRGLWNRIALYTTIFIVFLAITIWVLKKKLG